MPLLRVEPSKTHYRVKLRQNLTSSFQVVGILYPKSTKIYLEVKGSMRSSVTKI